ncbi:MAG: DUF2070 family protein [Candidatus Marsarchaeota archaeon]|nr:DUF2070 family protein [Candidatus Marsarchaeota archaeon]
MTAKDSLMSKSKFFTKKMPETPFLLAILFVISAVFGIASVAAINYNSIITAPQPIVISGLLTGLLVIMLPTLLTVITIKVMKRKVQTNYLMVVSIIGAFLYAVFIAIGGGIYAITSNYYLANAIVLVGDAGILLLWFFISKVLFAQRKGALIFAVIQPILNIMVYIASSTFIFTFKIPLSLLLVKLSAGLIVFGAISYTILYIIDNPMKKNVGLGGIDSLAQFVQEWLFGIDVNVPGQFGSTAKGVSENIDTHTLVFKNMENKLKAIVYSPYLHYGPAGTMGGSNFPYMLEKYARNRYKVPVLIMHPGINEDYNPISSYQFGAVKRHLDIGVRESGKIGGSAIKYFDGKHNDAKVSLLSMNGVTIATFTRAPRITEDISPEANRLLKELLAQYGKIVLLDAHNSRYESAPNEELLGIKTNTRYIDDYISAIRSIDAKRPKQRASKIMLGASSVDLFNGLKGATDLAPGNLNCMLFSVNGRKIAILNFNANNMLPSFREEIVSHVKHRYNVECELYTTDTHFVNSLVKTARNVMGRTTKAGKVIPFVDRVIQEALSNMEHVELYYKKGMIKNFKVWGPNAREKITTALDSLLGLARIIVPLMIVAGFIISSWIISLI